MIVFIAILFAWAGVGQAQRPANISLCDYYAQSMYGANTNDTQYQLVQGIVTLAFGGGFKLPNVSADITGILNPGVFQNINVDLLSWFNGTKASTNLNDQAVGLNWLDDGGIKPLYNYITGATTNLVLTNTSNEYRLFNHFFVAFAHIFGCSNPPASAPSTGGNTGSLSLAYIHKYMNLNYTDLGYFIDQLSKSTLHYGFSSQDSQTLSTSLNSLYNVRCAPPITINPAQGPQLLSLCQDPSCPLAVPSPNCAIYANLTANGLASSAGGSTQVVTATATPSGSVPSTSAATTFSAATSSTAPEATSMPLTTGAIAGIAVGSVAGVLMVVGAIFFCLRRQRRRRQPPPPQPEVTPTLSQASPIFGYVPNHTNHASYISAGPTIAEMESPREPYSPNMRKPVEAYSPNMTNPVEVDGYRPTERSYQSY